MNYHLYLLLYYIILLLHRDFQEGTLDFSDCESITIEDTTFNGNGAAIIGRTRTFQGGAGGLSIQYSDVFSKSPRFLFRNVTFMSNMAGLNENLTSTGFTEVTSGDSYTGRGGAIFLLLQNRMSLEGLIEDCRFINNSAALYGGAVYVAFNSISNHLVYITDSQFGQNSAELAGGAIFMSYQEGGDDEHVNSVFVNESSFRRNWSPYGGAVYFFVSITAGK